MTPCALSIPDSKHKLVGLITAVRKIDICQAVLQSPSRSLCEEFCDNKIITKKL